MDSETGTASHELDTEAVSVIVPAYDEEEAIADVLDTLMAEMNRLHRPYEVLVVDDGSTDRTAAIAREHGARVVCHDVNRGYGASVKTALHKVRYDLLVLSDADGTYPVNRIGDLLALMRDDVEMAVGARTDTNVHIPLLRRPPKWLLTQLATYLTKHQIPDLNSGLRAFRRSTAMHYLHLYPEGFSFTTTITLAYHVDFRSVRYLPIDYERRTGKSKISPISDTYNFFLLILRTVMYFDPMRVLMPPALICFFLSGILLIYDMAWNRNIGQKGLIFLLFATFFFGTALLADLIVRRLAPSHEETEKSDSTHT